MASACGLLNYLKLPPNCKKAKTSLVKLQSGKSYLFLYFTVFDLIVKGPTDHMDDHNHNIRRHNSLFKINSIMMTRIPHVHLPYDIFLKWILNEDCVWLVNQSNTAFGSRGCKVNENSTYKRKVFCRGILSLLIFEDT